MRPSFAFLLAATTIPTAIAIAATGCSTAASSEDDDDSAGALESQTPLEISDDQRREIVSKKSTCPFVGTAIALKKLVLYGTFENPFASISSGDGNAVSIGNIGRGDLGEGFRIVARANHHANPDGLEAPNGLFSLSFPASVGAHAAHSFILMGDPRSPKSGRLNEKNLDRLVAPKDQGGHAETAPNGTLVVRRSELGQMVAQDIACDPNAVTASSKPFALATMMGRDLVDFNARAFDILRLKLEQRDSSVEVSKLMQDMVQIAVSNNIVGSAAEFGLLTTFLAPSRETVMLDGEPALSVHDIVGIYAGDKKDGKYDPLTRRFPANWETTPKTILDLVKHTLVILKDAAAAHLAGDYRENAKHAGEFPICPDTR
jgi:hypothetical protein